jgi:hypothetical protein
VNELRDPFFSSVPFDRWQAEGKRKQIRWDVEFFPVELSVHQRLLARVRVEIDRNASLEPVARALAVLIEYRDESGGIWQTHTLLGAGRESDGGDPETIVFGNAFVLPGSYTISVAVFDRMTNERSFVTHRIQAKAPPGDPLPHAWNGLPAVEFLPARADAPDEWYLPSITTRLALAVPTRRPVRLDVLVNATPGGNMAGSMSAVRRNMSVLIPSLKVVSQIEPEQGSVNVRLLDLVARRIAYEQNEAHYRTPAATQEDGQNWPALDWPKLRRFFIESRPGIVDASALAWFWKMRSFFWDQVLAAPAGSRGEARVVLILSGPAFFPGQEPLSQSDVAGAQNACIYYVRYRPFDFARRARPRPGARPFGPSPAIRPMPDDELEIAARKLNARVFDVTSPAEFRKVIAAVMGQLARL